MRLAALMFAAAAVAAAGCGSEEQTPVAAKTARKAKPAVSSVIEISAIHAGPKPMRFDKKKLSAEAGLVEIRFSNDDTLAHNIRIQTGPDCCDPANDIGGTNTVSGKQKETGRVQLEPGEYWFLCSINSHYDTDLGKMKGKLIVQ